MPSLYLSKKKGARDTRKKLVNEGIRDRHRIMADRKGLVSIRKLCRETRTLFLFVFITF